MRIPYDQNDSPRNLLKIESRSGPLLAIPAVQADPAAGNQTVWPGRLLRDGDSRIFKSSHIPARNWLVDDTTASGNTLCECHSKAHPKGEKVVSWFALLLILVEFYRPTPALERQTTSERP
jgi:hypothetical protein